MRSRWPWAVAASAVAGLALLPAGSAVPLLAGRDRLQTAANVAQLTGLVVAAASAAALVLVWAARKTRRTAVTTPRAEEAADVLARVVAGQWTREAALRSLDDPDPVPVRWRSIDRPGLMDHPANIGGRAGAPGDWWTSSDRIAELAGRFRATRRRRLVIAGGPGAGKTTLAVQLLLRLLATRAEGEPVPVLLPVAGWDTAVHPRLQTWLTGRLLAGYPALRAPGLGAEVVEALVESGGVLPVLDGLDELPAPARTGVITALNRSLGGGGQLVLTSRLDEYAGAVAAAGDVLTSAVVLRAVPLTPAAAADHLALCLPPEPGPVWERVLAGLRAADPSDPAGRWTPLADLTATPLGLWLLRAVYTAPGADPAPLADPGAFPDTAALRIHLFDRLVPALIAARPPSGDPADPFRPRRHRDPDRTRRWLAHLARHLSHPRDPGGAPRTRDLAWWHLARHTPGPVHRPAALLTGLAVAAVVTLALWPATGTATALSQGIVCGAMAAAGVRVMYPRWALHEPGSIDLRRLSFGAVAEALIVIFSIGLGPGLAVGLAALPSTGHALPLGIAVAGAGVAGAASQAVSVLGRPSELENASTPLTTWRADRVLNLFGAGWAVFLAGIGYWLFLSFDINERVFGRSNGGNLTVTLSIVFGISFSTVFVFGEFNAWWAYVIVVRRLARAGDLPRDLMRFLDDAHRLGLLRAVGPVYQFRHAELQDHLAADASGGAG